MNLQFIVPLIYPCGLVAFLWSLSRPHIGVYYLTLVLPLQTLRYQVSGYPLGAQIVDIVLLGILIGVCNQRRGEDFEQFPLRWILLLVTAYSYLSLWYGSFYQGWAWPIALDDVRFSLWRNWAEFAAICILSFAAIRTRKQIETVVFLMCLTSLALSWDFYLVMSSRDVSHYSWNLRYAGVLGYANPNGLAAFEAIFLLFIFGLYNKQLPLKLKIIIPPAVIACSYGLLFAFSRGAYAGMACGVVALGVMRRSLLAVVGIMVLAGALLMPSAVTDRIVGSYAQAADSTEASLDTSAMDRIQIWQNAIEFIKSSPLLGTGFNTYAFMHPMGYSDTHNLYLKLMLEQGAVGLLLFLVLLWKLFHRGYTLFRDGTDPFFSFLGLGFATSVVGTAVVNVFGDRWSYLQVDSYLWILLAVVCRAWALTESPEETDVPATEPAFSIRSVLTAGTAAPAVAPNS